MRTPTEALRELRSRLEYFCGRMDGKYDPPWATELVGIIDDATAQDAPTPLNMAECRSALEAIADSAKTGSISTLPSASLVLKTCEKALAAPARNCDRFGGDIDKLREACARERGLNPEEDFPEVFAEWLLAPSTERKGGAL